MASTISLDYAMELTVTKTFTDEPVGANDTITIDGYNSSGTLNSGTSVPVTKEATGTKALSAGAGTLDLTAIPGVDGTVDATGLKVQACKLICPTTNANPVTVTEGASNGYELLGNAFTFILKPGQHVTLYLDEDAPDVAAGAKNIDLAGTGSQELDYEFIFG